MQEVPMSLEERATLRGESDLEGARAVSRVAGAGQRGERGGWVRKR